MILQEKQEVTVYDLKIDDWNQGFEFGGYKVITDNKWAFEHKTGTKFRMVVELPNGEGYKHISSAYYFNKKWYWNVISRANNTKKYFKGWAIKPEGEWKSGKFEVTREPRFCREVITREEYHKNVASYIRVKGWAA